jgi:hypothetical protein
MPEPVPIRSQYVGSLITKTTGYSSDYGPPIAVRRARGEQPNRVRNARLKWAASLKPQPKAMSLMERRDSAGSQSS